eukprot:TRINITY_DN83401_c0_g1_i1.p1 TRINITY_DN83401_c0_g1~~TRINITY_DN83401_c0_g1_i1.p1  ORF type:complete len:300 (-),score=102.02 TRINITY_DN83401_c0_g1_i1:173-1072(-)
MAPKKKAAAGGGGYGGGDADKSKIAELAKQLKPLSGKGLVSISLPAGGSSKKVLDWLAAELVTANAMKTADTKAALVEALSTAKEKVEKLGGNSAATGLVVYAGAASSGSKQQKIAIDFAPFRPVTTAVLQVGSAFDLSVLDELQDIGGGKAGSASSEAALLKFVDATTRDDKKVCYGWKDTIQALEGAAVVLLLVWEGLELNRVRAKNKKSGEECDVYLPPSKCTEKTVVCPKTGEELEPLDMTPFVPWIKDNSWIFGVELEICAGGSPAGKQFCTGYGGIGALLRYEMYFEHDDEDA